MKTALLISAFFFCTALTSHGQWTYTNLSEPKTSIGATAFGSNAWFAGGHNGAGVITTVEIYNDAIGGWSTPYDLSVARMDPSSVTCGNKIIFAGGRDADNVVLSTVDIFDAVTGEHTVTQLSVPRLSPSAVSYGNKVLFAGGANLLQYVSYDIVDIYDVGTGQWTTDSLSEPRTTWGTVVGDKAIFAGGYNFPAVSKRVDIYNFTTGTWSIDSLSVARCWVGVTAIGDKVVIAGGTTADNNSSGVVDIYNATTGTWENTASLSFPRALGERTSVTAGGKAFFVGGGMFNILTRNWLTIYNVIDIYDEAHNTWSVDTLAQSYIGRGTVSLGDKFLVAGGSSILGVLSSEVEIYTCPPSSCLPAGITFSTQAEINDFQTDHPTCIEIEGDVLINGTDINNLNGLSVLTSIGGDLTIRNTSLVDLAGLEEAAEAAQQLQPSALRRWLIGRFANAEALVLIVRGYIEQEPNTARIFEEDCSGCKSCIPLCPYTAIAFDEAKQKAVINETLCKGCGTCVASCPSGSIGQRLFEDEEVFSEIKGVLAYE